MNIVNLIGRLTKPADNFSNQNGARCGFTLAVDRGVKDAQGNKQADFISCVAFGTTADAILKYTNKGHMIAINGRIQTGSYQDQSGKTVYTTNVVVERCMFLEKKEQPQPQQQYQDSQLPFAK